MPTDPLYPAAIPRSGLERAFTTIALLLAIAVAFGGGGVAYGLSNLVVQLAALGALAWHYHDVVRFVREAPTPLLICIGLTLALPLAQLVPLPPSVWQALPGRELASQAFAVAGIAPHWRPMSLDPMRTVLAAIGLVLPCTVIALGWQLPRLRLVQLGWVVVLLGVASFIWGTPQVLSQGRLAVPFPENPMPGVMFAGFANRNSAGLFFVTCLILALLLDPPGRWRWIGWLRLACAITFTAATFLTQSRSAIALAALLLAITAIRWLRHRWLAARMAAPLRSSGILAATLIALAGIASLVAAAPMLSQSRIATAIDRFDDGGGSRIAIWEDAAFAAQRYFPVGAGIGTFDEVFQLDESLEHLSPRKAGRAHNDYLELAIESGAPGLIVLALWLALLAYWSIRARLADRGWQAWAGALILLAFAAQSIGDYPLRNQSLMAIAGFAIVLLGRFALPEQRGRSQ